MFKVLLTALAAVAVLGCEPTPAPEVAKPADETVAANAAPPVEQAPVSTMADGATAPKNGESVAVLETDLGRIVLKFFPNKAPGHVKNFETLAKKGFYDGTKFHRTMPGFMIQGGDPNTKTGPRETWGTGGPGYEIKGEMNDIHHTRGILSMARSSDPNSGGSQFFITVADVSNSLDPKLGPDGKPMAGGEGYTVFGQVVEGMDVVDKIVALPTSGEIALEPVTIKKAIITTWPLKPAK